MKSKLSKIKFNPLSPLSFVMREKLKKGARGGEGGGVKTR